MIFVTKLLCLGLSAALFYHAYLIRKHSGTWLTPSGVWSILWFMFTFVPLLAVPTAPVNPLAIFYILTTSVIFSIPVFTTKWQRVRDKISLDPLDIYRTKFLSAAFYVISGIALVSLALNLSAQGVSINRLQSDFLSVTSELIVDRYTENTVESIFAQISNIFTYCSALIGGLVFFGSQGIRKKVIVASLAMVPSLALMAIAGAKGSIFLCLAIFYGSILAARTRRGDTRILDRKTITGALIAVACIFPFLLVSFLARGLAGQVSAAELSDGLYRLFVSYSSAHVYAFSDWFTWYIGQPSALNYSSEEVTGGFYTFMSIFRLFGSTKVVPPGYYDEYYQYSWFLQSNIYTVFRGLITDFTLFGSLAMMFVLGFFSNLIFISLVRSPNSSWSTCLYSLFCGLAYTSFIISILVWNSMYPVFLICAVILKWNSSSLAAGIRRSKNSIRAPRVAEQSRAARLERR